jgi:hypothetical protein
MRVVVEKTWNKQFPRAVVHFILTLLSVRQIAIAWFNRSDERSVSADIHVFLSFPIGVDDGNIVK